MHEHHQVAKLVEDVKRLAQEQNISKVNKIYVSMGDLLGFDEQSVKLYFETMGEGTILADAEVVINLVPGELLCSKCQKNFVKKGSNLNCPVCGTQGLPTETGKAFFVEKITG